ncbi:glycosyltransferase family 4 protein [Rhodococcoides corynebacterioides]|uniref:glycosyltransferase family 4 protein n=1 Tax=Rhodococcoides corynebacterioides TaxID=53972 RepID=UPI003F7DA2D7
MVVSQYPPVYGGAGKQAALLGEMLGARGVKVSVSTLDQNRVGNGGSGPIIVHRTRVPGWLPERLQQAYATVALSLRAFLKIMRSRPGAVHIHGAYWWSLAPAVAGRIVRSTVVLKVTRDGEDDPATVFTRTVFGFRVGALYGASFRLAHKIIFLSDHAAAAAEGYGLQPKIRRLNNGVRLAQAELGVDKKDKQPPVVLFVGYLVEHKGVKDLLRAWPSVRSTTEAELWLVGPGTGFYRELTDEIPKLISSAKAAGLGIRTLGHVPGHEMASIYARASVFTLPSYREGMPNSLAEALAFGCTVVATAIPGIVDIVSERDAYLIRPGSVAELSEALIKALETPLAPDRDVVRRLDIATLAETYDTEIYGLPR